MITNPKANKKMPKRSFLSSSLGIRQPSKNNSGGMNKKKNTSGCRAMPSSKKLVIAKPNEICMSGVGMHQGSIHPIMLLSDTAINYVNGVATYYLFSL